MKKRKLIALLSAVLMLCSIIPMGAINVSAYEMTVFESNFNDGSVGNWKSDETIIVENGALKWTTASWKNTYASFRTTPDTVYTLTFKMRCEQAAVLKVVFHNGSWGDSGIPVQELNVTTEWVEYTYTFNSGNNTAILLLFQFKAPTTFYLDDVKVVTDANEGVLSTIPITAISGDDFENGQLNGWSSATSTVVSYASIGVPNEDAGNYSMRFESALSDPNNENSGYKYTHKAVAVEENTNYLVTYSILSGDPDRPVTVRIRNNSDNADLAKEQFTPVISGWETRTFVFNSGNNTRVLFRVQSAWSTGIFFLDNLSITRLEDDGHIINGDFNVGGHKEWTIFSNAAVAVDPTTSTPNYVMKTSETAGSTAMFSQTAKNLKPNTNYKLMFKVYGYAASDVNSAFWVRFPESVTDWTINAAPATGTANDGAAYTARINVNSKVNTWHTVDIRFNSGNLSEALITFMNYRSGQGYYYFDDIMVFELKPVSDDGYLKNGDFETGAKDGWSTPAQTVIDTKSNYEGNFGAHLSVNSASWGGMLNQTITGLTPGAKYNVTFRYKVIQQGANWKIEGETQKSADKKVTLTSGYVNNKSWTQVSKDFIADATTARINFSGSGLVSGKNGYENGIDELYVDAVVITKVKDAPVYYEGKAISEDVRGLAFKFNMNDIVIDTEEDGYTAIYNDSNKVSGYKLIEMGAVMSNQSADATASRDNAGAAGVAGTIDIHAAKLWEDGEDTASFVVRILNIPLDRGHGDTTIYARPYYVVEIDNTQVTIYGAVQSASYNAVANG